MTLSKAHRTLRKQIVHMLAVPLALLGAITVCSTVAAQEKPEGAGSLPGAERVLNRAIDAMGGKKAFEEIESFHFTATIELAGQSFPAETHWMSDGRFRFTQGSPEVGQAIMSSDGTTVWQYQPHLGHEFPSDEEVERILSTAEMPRIIHWMKETYDTFETVGIQEFENAECYAVRMRADGKQALTAYFDVKTHRVRGTKRVIETRLGTSEAITSFSNWKSHGDLTLFMNATMSQSGMTSTMTFRDIEFNNVDESVFELPDEIVRMKREQQQDDSD